MARSGWKRIEFSFQSWPFRSGGLTEGEPGNLSVLLAVSPDAPSVAGMLDLPSLRVVSGLGIFLGGTPPPCDAGPPLALRPCTLLL